MKSKQIPIIGCLILLCPLISIRVFNQTTDQAVLKREIKIKEGQTYLNLPIKNTDRLVQATIKLNNMPLDRFTINLSVDKPDYWTFFDVSSYQGRTLTIELGKAPRMFPGMSEVNADDSEYLQSQGKKGLNMIFADSKFPGSDSLYIESGRPQVHFTASRGWINDPNGLIYYNGLYHMFFQHNPYGWQWGNMHWGHAVSKDLIHWEQWNEAIYPVLDQNDKTSNTGFRDAAFSGSAVIDYENTGGFRKNGIDPIIAIYTSTGRGECLKMSYDNGKTFVDYDGNPILVHVGRDPKVFWYEPGNHWVMVVWDSGIPKKLSSGDEANIRQHSIYTSPDLKKWTYESGIEGFFECPELFELPVEGEPDLSRWIMYDAFGRYIVGDFDGKKFTIEQHFTGYENGGGYFYASQTFNNIPDGRRIQVGWGRNITNPGMPFNQPELLPSELKLKRTMNGYRLCPTPIKEIATLFTNSQVLKDKVIKSGDTVSLSVDSTKPLHIVAEIERGNAEIVFNIMGYELRYDNEWIFSVVPPENEKPQTNKSAGPFLKPTASAPVTYVTGTDIFKIEAIVDKNILEFFINDGELYYVTAFNGNKTNLIEASVPQGSLRFMTRNKFFYILKYLEVNELKSIWSNKNEQKN
jgi:fructan beta-fructosidase